MHITISASGKSSKPSGRVLVTNRGGIYNWCQANGAEARVDQIGEIVRRAEVTLGVAIMEQ